MSYFLLFVPHRVGVLCSCNSNPSVNDQTHTRAGTFALSKTKKPSHANAAIPLWKLPEENTARSSELSPWISPKVGESPRTRERERVSNLCADEALYRVQSLTTTGRVDARCVVSCARASSSSSSSLFRR